ncbi:protein takeout-like [Musca autumnalis]|uniref:protein takeout-like n=1 Tax=Musca autumnalis TaxID=221902 RepID=UPI003CE9BB93
MDKLFTILFFIISVFIVCILGEFPNDPQPCKFGDTECIGKLIDYLMSEKYDGDDSLNLKQIDPLFLKKVRIHQAEDSPVNVDLILTNNSLYGWKTAKIQKVKGFNKDMTKKNQLIFKVDYLTLVGDYSIDGKILILPIKGSGQSNITMIDVTLQMDFVGTPMEKDGETYMTIREMQMDAEPKQIIYKVDNLFNGDKTLGDNMNLFLNENWPDIYQEVKESLAKGFSEIYADVINQVLSKYPYEKFFAE